MDPDRLLIPKKYPRKSYRQNMHMRLIAVYNTIRRSLFIDIFLDRRTRPIFLYVLVIVGIGTALFHWLEGWSWLDSAYFIVITLTTIGYGDLSPTTPVTKLITIFYGLNGVILLLVLFDVIRQVRGWTIDAKSVKSDKTKE